MCAPRGSVLRVVSRPRSEEGVVLELQPRSSACALLRASSGDGRDPRCPDQLRFWFVQLGLRPARSNFRCKLVGVLFAARVLATPRVPVPFLRVYAVACVVRARSRLPFP